MYCTKCGKENNDSSSFCVGCGAPLGSYPNVNYAPAKPRKKIDKNQIMLWASGLLALISIIMPFCAWVSFPVYDNIYSMFGGQKDILSRNLFNYVNNFSDDDISWSNGVDSLSSFITILLNTLAVAVLSAMVINIIFIIMSFTKKRHSIKLSMIGSITMLTSTILITFFMYMVSVLSFSTIHVTATPWIAIATAIMQIVLTVCIDCNLKNAANNCANNPNSQQINN